MNDNYDLIVFGGGPGGYVSAIRGSQLGLNVLLVEANELGGICLNWGCIPTKALLKVSELKNNISKFQGLGINIEGKISFDISAIIKRSRAASKTLSSGVSHLLKKNKVQVIKGFGSIKKVYHKDIEINILNSENKNITAKTKNLILATGSKPKLLPNIDLANKNIWTSKEAMTPNSIPKSITIIGSGAIGIEFASFYNDMGSQVTVIEMENRILPNEDEEISEMAKSIFIKRGIKFLNNASVVSIDNKENNVTSNIITGNKEVKIKSEKILIAIGITGNIENLGLDQTNVEIEKGHIMTDEYLETKEKNIYAIGDVTSSPWLAHKASHEGIIASEKIAGLKKVHKLNVDTIPGCTYSYPQIASIGLTEKQAINKGIKIKVGKFPFLGNGKAVAMGEEEGFVKTIFNGVSGELIGAHLIGSEVTELINIYSIAKSLETTEIDIMNTVFAHPTLSEALHESVLGAYNRAIHF